MPNIQIAIVGNKIDIEGAHEITSEEATLYTEKALGHKSLYYPVSAKTNVGIDVLFHELALRLPKETTNKKRNQLSQDNKNN